LILGVIFALAGGVLTYEYLRALDKRVQAVVAARDLRPRETIEAKDLRVVQVPAASVHPGALRNSSQVVGLLVLEPIYAGEQVLASRTDLRMAGRSTFDLELGQRAMFVAAGFARGAGASIQPGDYVDLVAVITGRGDPIAYRLGMELRVLELRDDRGGPFDAASARASLGGVLLAVPEPQVESIALALSCGHVYVVLRGVRDGASLLGETRKDVVVQ
jgi:Flp pilus assembly protein CpaB